MGNRYEISGTGAASTTATAQVELRFPSTESGYVREVGLFSNAALTANIGLGKAAAQGTGGTASLGISANGGIATSAGGVYMAWTTAPTAPTQFFRRVGLPAAIGNGIIWSFLGDGLLCSASTSLVLWNIATSSIVSFYFVWEE